MKKLRLVGVIGQGLFWVMTMVLAALTPGYSHVSQLISELGALGATYPGQRSDD